MLQRVLSGLVNSILCRSQRGGPRRAYVSLVVAREYSSIHTRYEMLFGIKRHSDGKIFAPRAHRGNKHHNWLHSEDEITPEMGEGLFSLKIWIGTFDRTRGCLTGSKLYVAATAHFTNPGCPSVCGSGYTLAPHGDTPGWGKVGGYGGGRRVANCNVCGANCNKRPACHSFECSSTKKRCNLNTQHDPVNKKNHEDYKFCMKNPGPHNCWHKKAPWKLVKPWNPKVLI